MAIAMYPEAKEMAKLLAEKMMDKKGLFVPLLPGGKKGKPSSFDQTTRRAASACGVLLRVRGPGPGRDAACRSLNATGFRISSISDKTPLPHNGCRPRKKRRF